MKPPSRVARVYKKINIHAARNDTAYWRAQSPQARMDALEEIRQEYHLWRYGSEPQFQRVYTIVKRQ